MTYTNLIQAAKIIETAKREVGREDGSVISPAWVILHHALGYLTNQAERELRGE